MRTMPHKHAEAIKAWADGAVIEFQTATGEWVVVNNPTWHEAHAAGQYRVKPAKPDPIVRLMYVDAFPSLETAFNRPNLRLTYDGETHKLIKAEILE